MKRVTITSAVGVMALLASQASFGDIATAATAPVLSFPNGLAFNRVGNLLCSTVNENTDAGSVLRYVKGANGYTYASTLPFKDLQSITGLAVDSKGDVFAAEAYLNGGGDVAELPDINGKYGTEKFLYSEHGNTAEAFSVAVNAQDDVIVTASDDEVDEFVRTATGGYNGPKSLPDSSTQAFDSGKATVDAAGDILISGDIDDQDTNKVYAGLEEYVYSSTGYHTPFVYKIGHNLSSANAITTNSSGQVFVSNLSNSNAYRFNYTSAGVTDALALPFGSVGQAMNLVLDSNGDIYVSDGDKNEVDESTLTSGTYSTPLPIIR